MDGFSQLLQRLEVATARLESVALSSSSTSKHDISTDGKQPSASSASSAALNEWFQAHVQPFYSQSAAIGGVVEEQVSL